MREVTGTDALFKLAFYADRIVLLDIVSPRSQVIDQNILTREAGHIDTGNDFTAPDPWLRRLGSALHLKDFGGNKDFLRDLIALKYEVDPDDPDESDDAQLRFIYIAFDQTVIHAEAVIAPDTISSNALFQVNPREFDKDKAKPSHFQFKPETRRRYTIVRPFKVGRKQRGAYDVMMEHADD
ncbi:hypothetical protein LZL87_011673 [Fusarium oxysporum]|nr:hypothetical protein LZL87_011673 [Fusarium oxysporum]